jgi:hypothetical protein
MYEEVEPRPIVYIPELLRSGLPVQGCILKLTLCSGRTIPGACIDSKGMIYGVLVQKLVDVMPNPVDFYAEEIIAVQVLNEISSDYHFI